MQRRYIVQILARHPVAHRFHRPSVGNRHLHLVAAAGPESHARVIGLGPVVQRDVNREAWTTIPGETMREAARAMARQGLGKLELIGA